MLVAGENSAMPLVVSQSSSFSQPMFAEEEVQVATEVASLVVAISDALMFAADEVAVAAGRKVSAVVVELALLSRRFPL